MSIEIIEGLYLGDIECVKCTESHKSIISLYPTDLKDFTNQLSITIDDLPSENLLQYFPTVVEFIDKFISTGVLVHCYAGSRDRFFTCGFSVLKDFCLFIHCIVVIDRNGSKKVLLIV